MADARRRANGLIDGVNMICPRCESSFNVLQYVRLAQVEGSEEFTRPIYKCPTKFISNEGNFGCGFLFSPADSAVLGSMI